MLYWSRASSNLLLINFSLNQVFRKQTCNGPNLFVRVQLSLITELIPFDRVWFALGSIDYAGTCKADILTHSAITSTTNILESEARHFE